MARSLNLFVFLAALTLVRTPSAAVEPGVSPTRSQVSDPYYARRAQVHGAMAAQFNPVGAGPVARAQYEDQGAFRPTLMNPYSDDESEIGTVDNGMVFEGSPDASPLEMSGVGNDIVDDDTCHDGNCGDDTCGDDSYGDDSCGDGSCGDGCDSGFGGRFLFDPCRSGHRIWANFDYLNWKVHGDGIPPLLTTSSPGTPQSDAGVLGEPNTSVLFGNERLNNDQRSGGRVQFGYWLDPEGYTAVEGYYYALETATQEFSAASNFSDILPDQQILARPFNNIFLNLNDSLILAFPNFDIGGLIIDLNGQFNAREWSNVQSAGALFRQLWKCGSHCNGQLNHRVYMIGGYRFFRLAENLQINHAIEPVGNVFLEGTRFTSHDEFGTRNLFHGADLGMINEFRWWRFSVESVLKIAVGNMHQELDISGFSTTFDGLVTTSREGGLLALPTNIGHFNRDLLTLIPEVEVKIGLQITPAIRATIGYDFTYISRVMRPGHQLDLVINPTQRVGPLEGPARPLPVLQSTDVFMQGATAGLEFRY